MASELAQHNKDRLSFFLLSKHANILAKSLPEYQEIVNTSVHKCIPI